MRNSVAARAPESGLSLAEIPVALLVVSLVLIVAIRTFSTAGSVQRDSHLGNQATAYGTAKLHEMEAWPRSQIAPGADSITTASGTVFRRTWTVADKAACKEVNVTVAWRSGSRVETISLATLLR